MNINAEYNAALLRSAHRELAEARAEIEVLHTEIARLIAELAYARSPEGRAPL